MTLADRLNRLPVKAGAAFFCVYVISQVFIAMLLGHKVGAELVPMQLAFSKHRFDTIVTGWSTENLAQFQHHYYLDFIHPLWYGVTLAWALAKTLPPGRKWLVWLPVVAALCDLCENVLHAIPAFNGTFRELDQPVIALSSTFAATKWLLAAVSVVLVVVYFIRARKPSSA